MNTENNGEKLCELIDQMLLAGRWDCVHNFFNAAASRARDEGIEFNGDIAVEYFWNLARIGVVAIPGGDIAVSPANIPRLLLTDRGQRLLEKKESSPHNPSKYLSALRSKIAQPDEIALSYLAEAVEAWRCGLYRSSAIMLGCACERLVLMLAEAIVGTGGPIATKLNKMLQGKVFISQLFNEMRDYLLDLKDNKKLPYGLGDALDRTLSPIFDHARGLRNQSGHPTGEQVSDQAAEAGLLLFPGFYQLVDGLINEMKNNTVNGTGGVI